MRSLRVTALLLLLPLTAARAADPPLPTAPYTATVYFAPARPPQHNAAYDLFDGKVIGHVDDKTLVPGIWSSPTAFTPLPTLAAFAGYQPVATDGKTIAALAFKANGKTADFNAAAIALWTDPAKPPTVFAPPGLSQARPYDVCGGQVVGYAGLAIRPGVRPIANHPFLFQNNTFTDLAPPDVLAADVHATDGKFQYGSITFRPGSPKHQPIKNGGGPVRWNGAANDFIDFTPPGKTGGAIRGARGALQVGSVQQHAALWRGTAASFVDIHIPGFAASYAEATNGDRIVGFAFVTPNNAPHASADDRAIVWIDQKPYTLHPLLPREYLHSHATRIDAQGNILGTASSPAGTATIVWTPTPPAH
jgi:hypothetical protein